MSETIHQRIDAIVEDFTHAAASDARLGSCAACSHPSCERKRQEERDARIAGRELAEYIAAARAEVERLTARLEIDLGGSDKIDELTYALEYVRTEVGQARRTSTYWKDELAAANRECEALSVRASKAEADLAAVRKVEEWHGGLTGRHIVQCADGRFVAAHYPAQQTAGAERIAAGPLDLVSLGRALAAQDGTDAT